MIGKIPTEQQEDPPEPVLTVKVASEVIRELEQEGKTCSRLAHLMTDTQGRYKN